jgi:hypothetical protein
MSQSLILIDALSSACWEKEGERKEMSRGLFFFPARPGFSLLLDIMKSCLKGQSLNFMFT